ncbi:MAG: cupin domain-containing protein [Rhizobiaceae bacterium]|nr:cupin domain-containing protein [Rhizobiaceae bacterium]
MNGDAGRLRIFRLVHQRKLGLVENHQQNQERVTVSGPKHGNESDGVGERLAALRAAYGLSQRELARRAGLTNGTISLIEQGATSPQVASLKKILSVFSISIADFFSLDMENVSNVFFTKEDLVEIGGSDISFLLVNGRDKNRKLQMVSEKYEPGADTGVEMLQHSGEECGIVLKGSLEVTVGVERKVLKAGEAYYFNSSLPHRFRNVGDDVCEVVSAATPPSF